MRDLLTVIEVEPSALSQQLAVLRRSGIVTAAREGSTVVYELAGGDVADQMGAVRRILTEMLAGAGPPRHPRNLKARRPAPAWGPSEHGPALTVSCARWSP